MQSTNVFKTLSKYGSREEENYLTEALVLIIKTLIERQPDYSLKFLNSLCGLSKKIEHENLPSISISTQVAVDEGRLDIEIKLGSAMLTYIEVKHDACLGDRQLEYYKRKLDDSGVLSTRLVLLTRSRASSQETTLGSDEYHHVCWYDIHGWLSEIITESEDGVSRYLMEEFVRFLEGKQMSLEQIKWEYINGVPALVALGNMLEVAILEAIPDVKLRKNAGGSWRGFNFEEEYFCGIRYDNPLLIVFENNNGDSPTYKRDLDLEKSHFFSLNQAEGEQLECLIKFIQKAKAGVTNIS